MATDPNLRITLATSVYTVTLPWWARVIRSAAFRVVHWTERFERYRHCDTSGRPNGPAFKWPHLAVWLVLSTPAFAQTPVYTNADLGRLHSTRPTSPIAEETWRGLEARAFRWYPPVPQRPLEPSVVVVGTVPVPFPKDPACCRLDGSRWTDPAWSVTTYLGHDRGRRSRALPPASRRR